jgi:hypothetical protein
VNRREFFDTLGNDLNFKTLDQFYGITIEDVKHHGGSVLLHHLYENFLVRALEDVYPQHQWYAWNFSQNVGPRFWDRSENRTNYLLWLGKHLGFKNSNDWNNIKKSQIMENGGSGLLDKYGGSPNKLLMSVYHLQ